MSRAAVCLVLAAALSGTACASGVAAPIRESTAARHELDLAAGGEAVATFTLARPADVRLRFASTDQSSGILALEVLQDGIAAPLFTGEVEPWELQDGADGPDSGWLLPGVAPGSYRLRLATTEQHGPFRGHVTVERLPPEQRTVGSLYENRAAWNHKIVLLPERVVAGGPAGVLAFDALSPLGRVPVWSTRGTFADLDGDGVPEATIQDLGGGTMKIDLRRLACHVRTVEIALKSYRWSEPVAWQSAFREVPTAVYLNDLSNPATNAIHGGPAVSPARRIAGNAPGAPDVHRLHDLGNVEQILITGRQVGVHWIVLTPKLLPRALQAESILDAPGLIDPRPSTRTPADPDGL